MNGSKGDATVSGKKVKVLIVDDSALIRRLLTEIFSSDPDIEVVGSAMDPYAAREKIKKLNPDVITLDIEMPKMDGLTFLGNLMRLRPMPVIMFSSLTQRNADATMQALELGAVDFVGKPSGGISHSLEDVAAEITAKVKMAADVNVEALSAPRQLPVVEPKLTADEILPARAAPTVSKVQEPLIAIGASTGGVEALMQVLSSLPHELPPIVITQHIPATFSESFAQRADKHSALSVFEARDGQEICAGCAYIAPGSHHLLVTEQGGQLRCKLSDGPPVNRHKPSVDVLFRSVTQVMGNKSLGILLTGMGDDGARGLLEMREAGCNTVAQDKASSVVWGMPGSAVKLNAAERQLALIDVPHAIVDWSVKHPATKG